MPIRSDDAAIDQVTMTHIITYKAFARIQKLCLDDLPSIEAEIDKLVEDIPQLQVSEEELRADYQANVKADYEARRWPLTARYYALLTTLFMAAEEAGRSDDFRDLGRILRIHIGSELPVLKPGYVDEIKRLADLAGRSEEFSELCDAVRARGNSTLSNSEQALLNDIKYLAIESMLDNVTKLVSDFGNVEWKDVGFVADKDFSGCHTYSAYYRCLRQIMEEMKTYFDRGTFYNYVNKYHQDALANNRNILEAKKISKITPAILENLPTSVLSDYARLQTRIDSLRKALTEIEEAVSGVDRAAKEGVVRRLRDASNQLNIYRSRIPALVLEQHKVTRSDIFARIGSVTGMGTVALGVTLAVLATNPIGLTIATAAVVVGGIAIIAATVVLNRRSIKSAFQKAAAFFTKKPAAPIIEPEADDASLASALTEEDRAVRDADVESVASDLADVRSAHDDDNESVALDVSEEPTDYAIGSDALPAVDADDKSVASAESDLNADQFVYLAPEFKVAGKDKQLTLREVYGDGDCGYVALKTTREASYQLLNANAARIASAIKLIIIQELAGEKFRDWLLAQKDLQQDLHDDVRLRAYAETPDEVNTIEQKLKAWVDHADATLVKAYLKYDVQLKLTEGGGYAHPAILQQLAHLQNKQLRIWEKNAAGELELAPDYSDKVTNEVTAIDILFSNKNHFDGLDDTSPIHAVDASLAHLHDVVASLTSQFNDEAPVDNNMPGIDPLVLTDEMRLIAVKLESDKGSAAGAVARDTARRVFHIPVDADSDSESDEQEAVPVASALQKFSNRMASSSFTSTSSSSSFWSKSPLHKDRESDALKPTSVNSSAHDSHGKK